MHRSKLLAIVLSACVGVDRPAATADDEYWQLGLKLVKADVKVKHFEYYHMVLKHVQLNRCQWAYAFPIHDRAMQAMGLTDLEDVRQIKKCGPSIQHLCTFVDTGTLQANPHSWLAFQQKYRDDYLGFAFSNHWAEDVECSGGWVDKDEDEFHYIDHPFKSLFPSPTFISDWLQARLSEHEFIVPDAAKGQLARVALEQLPEVCTDSVSDSWDVVWPGESTASSMIIIGCGNLRSEPTQPLLDKGSGGLFIDMDRKRIREAIREKAAPNRMILNMSVRAHTIKEVLKQYDSYVQNAEVLQVDIDTTDGPVVMALLELTKPLAISVEVRDFLPMPFRYACLTPDTKGVAWGGANLAYWMHELGKRKFHLARMDRLDAVFFHESVAPPPTAEKLLGALACYLLSHVFRTGPLSVVGRFEPEHDGLLRHHWMSSDPHSVVDEIWQNLTKKRGDIRFVLDV